MRLGYLLLAVMLLCIPLHHMGSVEAESSEDTFVSNIIPADHGWVDDPIPSIGFELNTSTIIPVQIELTIFTDDLHTIIRSNLSISNSSKYLYTPNRTIPDGHYLWMINMSIASGDHLTEGPYHFSIDTISPEPVMIERSKISENSTINLTLLSRDQGSGIDRHVIEFLKPDGEDLVKSSMIDVPFDGNRILNINTVEDTSKPLILRSRAMDKAGNIGPYSGIIRCDPYIESSFCSLISGSYTGPNRTTIVKIHDPLGIDIGSIEYISDHDAEENDWSTGNVSIIRTAPLPISFQPLGPTEIMIKIHPEPGPMERSIKIRWKDLAPFPYLKYSIPLHQVYMKDPPEIEIVAPSFVQMENVRISLFASWSNRTEDPFKLFVDEGSGIWKEPERKVISRTGEGWRVDLEMPLVMGETRTFGFMMEDPSNNTVTANHTVRATRPPMVTITGPKDERIDEGSLMKFIAIASDPDNDTLSYNWNLDGNDVWSGRSFSDILTPGFHNITVNVSDGAYFDTDTIKVFVNEKENDQDEEEGRNLSLIIIMIIILVAASALIILLFHKRKSGKGSPVKIEKMKRKKVQSETDRGSQMKVVCEVCLENIDGREVECRCGNRFHRSCASKAGKCPSCSRELLI